MSGGGGGGGDAGRRRGEGVARESAWRPADDAGAVTASVPAPPRRVRPYRTPRAPVVAIATPPITTGSSTYAWRRVRAAYRRVYDSRHLEAGSQEPGSARKRYAR